MTRDRLTKVLEQHILRIEHVIERRKKQSNTYSRIRIIYFLTAVLGVIWSYGILDDEMYLLSLISWVFLFLVIVHFHRKIYESQEKFEHLRDIKKEHLSRMDLDWDPISFDPLDHDMNDHAFARDFNIPGKHSLFHLLDTSIYPGSGERLLSWLTTTDPDRELIRQRQQQIRELRELQPFRDKLRVINKFTRGHVSEKDWTLKDMILWLRKPVQKGFQKPLWILSALSVTNITMIGFVTTGLLNPLFLVAGFVTYLVCYNFYSDKISGLFDSMYNMEKILGRFTSVLLLLEDFKASGKPALKSLLNPFQGQERSPSNYLRKVQKLMNRAALKVNQIVWILVNFMVPWDMYYAWRVESLKEDLEVRFSEWVDVFYELEALNSLATFAQLHPGYCWPEFTEGESLLLDAKNMGHPLIEKKKKVTNDFKVEKGKDLFLITGSNMAGKSTFLRTIGINLALANAGAPVNATSFRTGLFRLFSSININDSLDDGISHFYAEVRRLKVLLNELSKEDDLPLFYFVDEIYKGTNNRERYAGSAAFLKEVAGKNGVGMVSSHDLELAELEKQIGQLSNWHFAESIEDGKMSFEYKIKPGPCPTTNALQIMRMEGLPVE